MLLTFIAALVLVGLACYNVGLVVQHNRDMRVFTETIDEVIENFVGNILTKLENAGLDESTPGLTEAIYEMIEEMEGK
jgi:hypothetical protein